jgi:hypothetical protein
VKASALVRVGGLPTRNFGGTLHMTPLGRSFPNLRKPAPHTASVYRTSTHYTRVSGRRFEGLWKK